MCGRYALKQVREAEEYFRARPTPWRQSLNIAPSQQVAVLRRQGGERQGVNMRWGLIPHWSKDASIAASTINARSETAAEKPAFSDPLKFRRCLIPADGFYE